MMESCFNNKLEREEAVDILVDDLKKDLFSEFNSIPLNRPDSQDSSIEEREHLQVYLRIRPFTTTETENGESQDCVGIEVPDTVLLKAPRASLSARLSDKSDMQTAQRFQFSQVYGPETTQREIFDGTVKGLVRDVLEGGNSLVFTYGVTNAGKTFTFLGPDTNVGLLPRSLNIIFNSIEERIYHHMNIKPQRCREFVRLTKDQESEEATNKRNLFRLLKETDAHKSMANSTCKTSLEGSTLLDAEGTVINDSFSLDLDADIKFSVWVSFCEIYNENIHDLLEAVPSGALKRTTLKLSQDIKGNSFVKDLRWVQVNSAEEAYKVMKLGKRNQSFSSTKLNHLSSRSHSIFSIRVLRIKDVGIPRVSAVSELSLCDLAGSERCAKTQNKGERLKEAGNINTSMLILGKCINALRHNQTAKLLQHVPFRESKLTHYLQGFFCGRGKACMIVNINQCASTYDETLNVLKFSAVAQKVVVLTTKTIPNLPKMSAREVSFIINNANRKELSAFRRRSSLVGWETSLEDLRESEDDDDDEEEEEEEEEDEESMMEETIHKADSDDEKNEIIVNKLTYMSQVALLEELQELLRKERADSQALEGRVREEVSKEFSELFSQIQTDCNERLLREKEIIEERAERRLEILKNLVTKNTNQKDTTTEDMSFSLDGMIDSMCSDLAGIRQDAHDAHTCLGENRKHSSQAQSFGSVETMADLEKRVSELSKQLQQAQEGLSTKTTELRDYCSQAQQANEQLYQAKKSLEAQEKKFSELMEMCHEKDEAISKLQTTMDLQFDAAAKDKAILDSKEICCLDSICTCSRRERPSFRTDSRKRQVGGQSNVEEQPPLKKGSFGEEEEDGLQDEMQDFLEEEGQVAPLAGMVSGVEGCGRLEERLGELQEKHLGEEQHTRELTMELREAKQGKEEALTALMEVTQGKEEALTALMEVKQGKEEALTALIEAKQGKEEALTALMEVTQGKEEALTALIEAKQGKEEALTALMEVTQGREEALTALIEAKQGKEEALTALMEVTQGREEALTALMEVTQGREEALAALMEVTQGREEALAAVTLKKEEVINQTTRAEQTLNDLQAELERYDHQLRDKNALIETLTLEVKRLGQESEVVEVSSGSQEDVVRKELSEAQEEREKRLLQVQTLEQELGEAKDQLSQQQLTSDQQVEILQQKLKEQQLTLEEQLEDLEQKLAQNKLSSEREIKELKEKFDPQVLNSEQQLQEFKQKLAEQELNSDHLKAQLEEAAAEVLKSNSSAEKEELSRLNSNLEAEVLTLRLKVTDLEEKQCARDAEKEATTAALNQSESHQLALPTGEMERRQAEKEVEMERRLAEKEEEIETRLAKKEEEIERRLAKKEEEVERRLAEKEEEVERRLAEKQAQVTGLQRSLREAQERREEEESTAVQEARRREVERRRELLAVAEEAIAEKNAELEKKAQEVSRLKEAAKLDSDKVKSISLDLQRKEDDTSDLKEKLADSKKQIQQVQKEICSMRDEEKFLRQKLLDLEKAKKQFQADLASRDKTIQHLRTDSRPDDSLQLYQQACKDLQAGERAMEDMRLALVEQEETQEQLDQVLEERQDQIQALADEVGKLRSLLGNQDAGEVMPSLRERRSDDFKLANQEAARAQESLKLSTEKHQADRRKWLEEKMVLIRQAKETEDKRNQEIRKFAEDREKNSRHQRQMEALSATLHEKEQDMERWRMERDTLVAALEVQLQKLLSSNAEKDKLIASLSCSNSSQPPETQLDEPVSEGMTPLSEGSQQLPAASCTRTSVSSSQGNPSVLDSSQISTENGRTSRFPKPELEISFSPLQPNRMALRRQGQDEVTVKITRSARKRKSTEPDKDEVENENRRNTRTRLTPKLAPHQEEWGSPAGSSGHQCSMQLQDSQSSLRSRKEGTLQKIGDFLHSSPNLFGSKAKKIMKLVSGRSPDPDGGSSLSARPKKPKRALYHPEISSPMDLPPHAIINRDPEEKESDRLIIKRRLRSRTGK
ncbi:kinesin-like protein KIF20B isoform X2 [Osmerus eperlanus]|uniref:kinesin-like protein KIF20B isoform X2 n=1 Tax=Osmerus eperlanus TaxID=29151 RepID=UPI002E0D6D19